ncbi:MAG: class I SAM-dependent methyltransferase [Acidobacteria bacterium]|nr:class I SAM-dependent methyltransferase [Acidobacteriota bacterium]
MEFSVPFEAGSLDYYIEQYADDYAVPRAYEDIDLGYRFTIQKIAEAAARLRPDQRRVLDVGCGRGYLLVDLQRRGFECLGIDFHERLVRFAVEQYGVPARVERLENLLALGESYDLVILSHVLEHVDDPAGLLRNVFAVLNPGGLLVVELPNRNWFSLGYSLRRGNMGWNYYPPDHITFWSLQALRAALQGARFDVLECVARPFDDLDRVGVFVRTRLRLSSGPLFHASIWTLKALGRLFGLEGNTLNALARKADTQAGTE